MEKDYHARDPSNSRQGSVGSEARRHAVERYKKDALNAIERMQEFLRLNNDEEGWSLFQKFKDAISSEKDDKRLLHMIHIVREAINEVREGDDALAKNVNSRENLA